MIAPPAAQQHRQLLLARRPAPPQFFYLYIQSLLLCGSRAMMGRMAIAVLRRPLPCFANTASSEEEKKER